MNICVLYTVRTFRMSLFFFEMAPKMSNHKGFWGFSKKFNKGQIRQSE